jgi:hypothetical protein
MRTCYPAAAVAVAILAGCAGQPKPDIPMPTDGPNQVVLKVPGMT